jgi:hypothetical protein
MLRRILTLLFAIILALLLVGIIALLIIRGGEAARVIQNGPTIVSVTLNALQLLGIIVLLFLFIFILFQYVQYARSRRFVFDGFSNVSKLTVDEKMPLEFTMLAREVLGNEFNILYNQWKRYSSKTNPNTNALLLDELFFEGASPEQNLAKYVSPEMTGDNGTIEDLKKASEFLKDAEGINLIDLAGEIAPKEVTPIMKFIEAIIPPRIIRVTGHLQWSSVKTGRAGITFEFVDLNSRRNLMVRTIWWRAAPLDNNSSVSEEQEHQGLTAQLGDDEMSHAAKRYIGLLGPAMRWLALMFWEQRMQAHTPFVNYFLKHRESRRQAQLFYLLGSLYYASATQFSAYKDFFCQLAVEHFRQATTEDKSWYSPYLYLGNLYRFKMQEQMNNGSDAKNTLPKKLLDEALNLFSMALERAKSANEGTVTEQRIILVQALAEQAINPRAMEFIVEIYRNKIEGVKAVIEANGFDFEQADRAGLLYNLALWYGVTRTNWVRLPDEVNARTESRRYLAYSLALSEYLREGVELEETFQKVIEEDLAFLKEELPKHKNLTDKNERERAKMTWVAFREAIDKILEKMDEDEDDQEDE